MTVINPSHPVIEAVGGEWHKIVALLMHKFGHDKVTITREDAESCIAKGQSLVLLSDSPSGIHLQLLRGDAVHTALANAQHDEHERRSFCAKDILGTK